MALVRRRSEFPPLEVLPLVFYMKFNDRAELIYTYKYARSKFVDLINDLTKRTCQWKVEDDVEGNNADQLMIRGEAVFLLMWGAESAFHKARKTEQAPVNICEAKRDEADEITEEERLYLKKKKAEWSKAKLSAGKEKRKVSAYGAGSRNAFYPLASNRWVKAMSRALKDQPDYAFMWLPELIQGENSWLSQFHAPSRQTQALMAIAQKQVMALVRRRSEFPALEVLPLVLYMKFNDWAKLIYTYNYARPKFVDLINNLTKRTCQWKVEDDVEGKNADQLMIRGEAVFLQMWGAESAFHKARKTEQAPVNICEAKGDEEDEITEEERLYLKKKKAEWSKAKLSAGKEKRKVSAYGAGSRNAFYPLASNRWVEAMSRALKGKIWTLET
ncbi:hypothetical protein CBR_g3158 [Chara braunii]|uniref:Uncharacterized protein n=1 Tax=Chara braunii TaxID=69332 RepID=A0A388KF31_CHABU|nr:hypothetical protein CBR_g3158 [Chara braunii]|eukprot:GBG68617.1 hypothetical protein CBR_g3158 [Chara braunii]